MEINNRVKNLERRVEDYLKENFPKDKDDEELRELIKPYGCIENFIRHLNDISNEERSEAIVKNCEQLGKQRKGLPS